MKRIAIILLLLTTLLCMPILAFAGSFGVSPGSAEFEVPKDGSTTQEFTFTGYTGTVTIGLENIPLDVSPIGDITVIEGETVEITFHGDGTNNTYEGKITFLASTGEQALAGIKIRLTIHVNMTTEVIPTPGPSGGNGAPTYSMKGNLFGETETFYTDYKGTVQRTVRATSQDGKLTVTIPKGTIALGDDGRRLKTLEVAIDETPPGLPEDANIIGLPYDFGPAGATFDPPITFTWAYDHDALPENVSEENLVLAYYLDGEWVELKCTVNTETNTITASVSHFTTFAIIGHIVVPTEPTPVVVPPLLPPPVPIPAPTPAPIPTPIPSVPEVVPTPPSVVEPVVPAVPLPEPSVPAWVVVLGSSIALMAVIMVCWLMRNRIKRLWRTDNGFPD